MPKAKAKAAPAEPAPVHMLQLRLPAPLHAKLRRRSYQTERTMTEIAREAIEAQLKAPRADP